LDYANCVLTGYGAYSMPNGLRVLCVRRTRIQTRVSLIQCWSNCGL